MKRVLLLTLVIGILLLSACGASTTIPEVKTPPSETSPTPPATEQPAPTPLREWWEEPPPALPEGSPPLPPKVIGSLDYLLSALVYSLQTCLHPFNLESL